MAEPVERYLGEFLDQRSLPSELREAARYALLGGGKRIRPVLVKLDSLGLPLLESILYILSLPRFDRVAMR